jgi:hypothetical protein
LIEVKEKEIVLVSKEGVSEGLTGYLSTYVKLYNDSMETYSWMKEKLNNAQKSEWERTIKSLREICMALDAGFGPVTPPRNWASGQLFQYVAPIPQHVRDWIDKAEPIFGLNRILIYDPNVEHFKRPKQTDPLAVAFVDLAEDRIFFEIGRWDIDGDLKFIDVRKDSRRIAKTAESVRQVVNIVDVYRHHDNNWHDEYKQHPTVPQWTTSGAGSGTGYGYGSYGGSYNVLGNSASASVNDSGYRLNSSFTSKMLGSGTEWKK